MSDVVANGPPMGPLRFEWPRILPDRRRLSLHVIGIAALAFVLVSSRAFGSEDLSVERRILMFAVVSALLVTQASLSAEMMRRLRGRSWAGTAVAAALAMTATLAFMTIEIHVLKATPIVPYAPDPVPEFALFLMPFVIPVAGFVLVLKWSGNGSLERPSIQTSAPPDLFDRPTVAGPPSSPGDAAVGWPRDAIRRVQAVDHYLQLWTTGGTMLVRGRMADAVRRLPAAAGIQPHRSWWVALSEIDRMERRGRDHALLLSNGDRVPVARARAGGVKRFLDRQVAPPAPVGGVRPPPAAG